MGHLGQNRVLLGKDADLLRKKSRSEEKRRPAEEKCWCSEGNYGCTGLKGRIVLDTKISEAFGLCGPCCRARGTGCGSPGP